VPVLLVLALLLAACERVTTDGPGTGTTGRVTTVTPPPGTSGTGTPTTSEPQGTPVPGTRAAIVSQIDALVVATSSAPEPYRRARFGTDWADDDRDCHDARAEVLMRDSLVPVTFRANGCTVDTGSWVDPWNGTTSTLASVFQIDHTVPLANAWGSGAWTWTDPERRRFANDLEDRDALLALEGSNNTAKSDRTPDTWRPQLRSSWCRYADAWSRIKGRWKLTVTAAERDALIELAASCPP
jgi:hypothetical protein